MRSALARTDRYSNGAIALHWAIAALLMANLALGLLHENLLDGLKWVMPLHKSIGLTVLALTVVRIGWRLAHRAPPLPLALPGWERVAAKATHAAFYALMLALPLTGWALLSGARVLRPILWFGLFQMPFLPVSSAIAGAAKESHELLGWITLVLIVLHIGAALRHHFMLRDTVLARMLPVVRSPR